LKGASVKGIFRPDQVDTDIPHSESSLAMTEQGISVLKAPVQLKSPLFNRLGQFIHVLGSNRNHQVNIQRGAGTRPETYGKGADQNVGDSLSAKKLDDKKENRISLFFFSGWHARSSTPASR
jgi:hypothetical protein